MATNPLRDFFRTPSRPATASANGDVKSGGAAPAAPAAPATPATAGAPAAPAAPAAQPKQASPLADVFDPKPATNTAAPAKQAAAASAPFVGGGNIFDDLFTDLFATAKHRSPSDRTNLTQYAKDHFGQPIPISSNDDDPFAKASNIEGVKRTDFDVDAKGNPVGLHGNRATISEEDTIFRKDASGNFVPFAWNPWPKTVAPDAQGRFVFDEPRFPPFLQERGPDGKPVIKDGKQVWTPNDLKVGATTTFEAMNSTSRASESWAGREIDWGVNGKLDAEPHAFIDFNAFYSPSAKSLFFGVVPYRLPGDPQVRMFETATSWEMVAHESGHAVQAAMMPYVDHTDQGFGTWGESFADQTAMWTSLKDRGRAADLLKEVNGNLGQSNSMTRMAEAFAALVGHGTGIRDAYQDLKVSNTSPEVHDRSQVLTGASYKIFQSVYQDQLAHGRSDLDALQVAGDVMGTLNLRATEHVPQNTMSLEDVGKAWLKVDKEYFGGKYGGVIADELKRREIFDDSSVPEFQAHEAALPKLSMGFHKNDDALNSLISRNLSKLGVGPGYDLKVVGHELDDSGAQIVHVQLEQTQGKGKDPIPLGNEGVLTFRPDGSLMDYQHPLPAGVKTQDIGPVLDAARAAGLDQHGVPVGIRLKDDGSLTAVAQYLPSGNVSAQVSRWTLDNPDGEVVNIEHSHDDQEMAGLLPEGAQILTADELANLDPSVLGGDNKTPADPGPIANTTASPFVAPSPPPPPPPAAGG